MNAKEFIEKVDKKKIDILKQSKLSNAELHMFLAGMNAAMEAVEDGGGNCCGWIPVSERLPEEGLEVLVTRLGTRGTYVTTDEYHDEFGWASDGDVIVWMHLPEPYYQSDN